MMYLVQADSTGAALEIETFGSAAGVIPVFRGQRSRGTAAARSAVQSGDALVNFVGSGYDAWAYSGGSGGMTVFANQTWTSSAHGTYVTLFSTADGSVTATERVRVAANGSVTVGAGAAAQGAGTLNAENGLYQAGVRAIGGSLGATDNAALRADGTGTFTAQGSALIIADTTGALSRSGNGGIPVQGTNTNDNAAAGDKGEYVSSDITSGSAVSLTTTTQTNITSISLTAGDWDVYCNAVFSPAATTNIIQTSSSVSTTSATLDGSNDRQALDQYRKRGYCHWRQHFRLPVCGARFSLSGTTTVYLVALAQFAVSTMSAYGKIWARRVR